MFDYNILIMNHRQDRKGDDAMRKAKVKRLVPLNVMVAPEDLEWIKAQTYGTGDSMGRVVRQLILDKREKISAKGDDK